LPDVIVDQKNQSKKTRTNAEDLLNQMSLIVSQHASFGMKKKQTNKHEKHEIQQI